MLELDVSCISPFATFFTVTYLLILPQECIKQHFNPAETSDMESDSEALGEPRTGECFWPSDSSGHDISDIEEITTRLPEELARLNALAPQLIPPGLLDTTIQGLVMIDKIIKKTLRNGRVGESRCLTEICSKCHQWLCAECLPNCTCREIKEVCEKPCETAGENRATLHTEETGGTEGDCQVHRGMYPPLFPSSIRLDLTSISDTRWKFCLKCGQWDLGSGYISDSDDETDWEYNSHRSHSSVGSSDPTFPGGLISYHNLWFASRP